MATNERLAALREEFETGTNPVVFIPYATALRRERCYPQAIEVCQKGLARHPGSVAGRTLLARLYCDIGAYEESRVILEQLYASAPDASGVRVALARTYIRMHEIERAESLLYRLNAENPMDPEVQILNTGLRRLKSAGGGVKGDFRPSNLAPPPTTVEEILESVARRMGSVAKVIGVVLVSLEGTFETVRLGQIQALREAIEAFREVDRACEELEIGRVSGGEIALDAGTILFACRGDELVMLCLEPSERMGPARIAFDRAIARLFPEPESTDTVNSEIEA